MGWKLGVVPYLNVEPLVAALREPEAGLSEAVELQAMVPSQLIGRLLAGEVDAALVSTAAVLPHSQLRILPEMAIAADGAVWSILLYARRPVEAARRVALDASSRSGAALARLLFAERWGLAPEFLTLPPVLPAMLEAADAALLIGDPAMRAAEALRSGRWEGPPVECRDLGAEWKALTGLPFVYAVWAAPADRDLAGLGRLLRRAKAWGLGQLERLAVRGAEELSLPLDVARDYLGRIIRYDLGERERAGIARFCELAIRNGILPAGSAARYAGG